MKHSIEDISISLNATIKDALLKMDKTFGRLLIVVNEEGKYFSLLSIGDVQRFLIKNQAFEAPIKDALRKKVTVGTLQQSNEEIEAIFLNSRAEFMPILDDNNHIVKVIFWEDLFSDHKKEIDNTLENISLVIMAGGKGTRLKPITNIIPKPLVPIGEKPIAEIILDQFKKHGIKNNFMSISYKGKLIKDYFAEKNEFNINYFEETKPLGTAGSLYLLKDKITDTFFVSNCDIIIDQNYTEVYKWHKENKNQITSIAAVKTYNIPYGTLELGENGILEKMVEKPDLTFLVNAGVYIIEPEVLKEIPENEFFHITHLMQKIKDNGGKVGVFPVSEGSWMDIGNWSEYNKTQELFSKRFK